MQQQETSNSHSGQTATALICIAIAMLYFVLYKIIGAATSGWFAVAAALSAIPSILFLTRARKTVLLRMAKLFSFPVAIAIVLMVYAWVKTRHG